MTSTVTDKNGPKCILCHRVGGAWWMVRLGKDDRPIHKACGDKLYIDNNKRKIFPSKELRSAWHNQEGGPTDQQFKWISLAPKFFRIVANALPPGTWRKSDGKEREHYMQEYYAGKKGIPKEDPSRFAFFRTHAFMEGDVEYALQKRKPPYWGFLLRVASGKQILFLENPAKGNAVFMFFFDVPGCLEDVRKTKRYLYDNSPESFLGSIRHRKGWEKRMLYLLLEL